MEDQGKRLMLAVAIAFGIMVVFQMFQEPEETPKDESAEVEGSKDTGSDSAAPDIPKVDQETETRLASRGAEQFFDFEFDNIKARFSSYDGSLVSWQLLVPRLRNPDTEQPEELVRAHDTKRPFLWVHFDGSTFDVPLGAEWKGEKLSETEMQFTWESNDIRVVKNLVFHPEEYLLMMKVTLDLVGAAEATQSLAVSLFSQEDTEAESGGMFNRVDRVWRAACYYDEEVHATSSKSLLKKDKKHTGQLNWGGFDHAYFLSALAWEDGATGRLDCNKYPVTDLDGGMRVDVVLASAALKKGGPGINGRFALYMGPKYMERLQGAATAANIETEFDGSVDLGFLAIIAGPLISLLNFLYGFVGNWGIAILLLTIVVKALTLPWTHKSMKSMKAMAGLKPQLEKIKEKYKDDRARQNVETMGLFKEHKVNPMSGCLPMLLQMPIWFALYRALSVAGQLYQAPFIPGWIDDLTIPDPLHIMPVLLVVMMFVQTRMTPSTGSGAQQKMLMYGMPIMFGGFSFFFPAGLTLYILTNTCFTALHHLYMRKGDDDAAATAKKVASVAAEKVIDVDSSEPTDASDSADDSDESKGESEKSVSPVSRVKTQNKNKKKSGNKKKRKR